MLLVHDVQNSVQNVCPTVRTNDAVELSSSNPDNNALRLNSDVRHDSIGASHNTRRAPANDGHRSARPAVNLGRAITNHTQNSSSNAHNAMRSAHDDTWHRSVGPACNTRTANTENRSHSVSHRHNTGSPHADLQLRSVRSVDNARGAHFDIAISIEALTAHNNAWRRNVGGGSWPVALPHSYRTFSSGAQHSSVEHAAILMPLNVHVHPGDADAAARLDPLSPSTEELVQINYAGRHHFRSIEFNPDP